MRKIILILVFCVAVAGRSAAETAGAGSGDGVRKYTLQELYREALRNSELVRISEEEIYVAEREKDRAFAGFLPTLSAYGEHTRYSESKMSSAELAIQPDYTNAWGVRLDQSLSLGGREFIARRTAEKGILKSMSGAEAVKEEYLISVSESYYDVLKAKKAVEIAAANVERLTKHRDAARVRLDVGEGTKTDLLRAEAELASARSDAVRADNLLRLARAVLARKAGIEGEFEIAEHDRGMDSGWGEQPVQEYHRIAGENRPEVSAAALARDISKEDVQFAKGLYWPTLSLEGVYAREENDPDRSFELNERMFATLSLNFPFFEGGLRRAEVRQAQARERQAELEFRNLVNDIRVEVDRAYLNVRTQRGVLSSLKDQLEFSRDNYNAVAKQFEYGLANSVDLIDANTLLVNAEVELARAEFDLALALLQLRKATGTLLDYAGLRETEKMNE